MLLTTQYLDEADQLADRIAVFDHGRVVAEGTPASSRRRSGAGVLRSASATPTSATRRNGCSIARSARRSRLGPTRAVLTRVGTDAGPGRRRARRARATGVAVADFALGQPSLDEVFLALTGRADDAIVARRPA